MSTLRELLRLIKAKTKNGGRVILETINPVSLLALAHNYFRDPSHRAPLHPETMRYLLELNGYRKVELINLAPYPEEVQFELVQEQPYYAPRVVELIQVVNRNCQLLNKLMFGYQDYALIGEVAEEK